MTRRRVDIIAPLDRLFDVEVDEPTWLRRVVAAVVPLIDDGFGVSAWVMQLPPAEMGFELIRQDWQDLLPKNLGEMHDEAGREEIDTAYRLSSGVDSLAQSYGRRFYESPLLKRWVHAQNIADAGGMHVRLGARTLIVSTILRRPAELPPAMKRYGAMLAGQMERAYRFRQALAATNVRPAAVLTANAKVVHAENDVGRSRALREELRRAITRREQARGPLRHREPDRAFAMYDGVVDGRFTIVDRFERDGRRYLVAYENAPGVVGLRALTRREREILERVAQGESVKSIAIDLGITPGAAAGYLHDIRQKTGLRSRAEIVRWFTRLRGST